MKPRLILSMAALAVASAADWPAFRGPNSSGVSAETNLPVEMSPAKNVVWRTPVAPGHSSPILVGDSIFLTGWEGPNLLTYNLDRKTGAIRWRRELARPRQQELHKSNSPASPSPVSDGRNVYAFFTDFGLISYGPDGNERWRLPLGPFNNPFGMGASPLLADSRIILNCDSETDSFLLAIDKDSGKPLWKVERPDAGRGFSTPILYRPPAGAPQALVAGSHQLTAYDVVTGRAVWWFTGLTWQLKPTPVMEGGRLYILGWAGGSDQGNQEELPPWAEILRLRDTNGDGRLQQSEAGDPRLERDWKEADLDKDGVLGERDWRMYQGRRRALNSITAIRLGGNGDMTSKSLLWRYMKSLPNAPSPLVYNGVVYLLKEGGILTALDGATGEVRKQARLTGALDQYFASPVAGDGKIFAISQIGHLVVLKAGPDWEILAVNDLDEECYATPALADGRVYVRTRAALYAFAALPAN
jgi:outer membrane protein assembly factor BamB